MKHSQIYIVLLLMPFLLMVNLPSSGQNVWWVYFKETSLNPNYLKGVTQIAPDTLGSSNWLNVLLVRADDRQLQQIRKLSFVKSCKPALKSKESLTNLECSTEYQYNLQPIIQVESLGIKELRKLHATGKGIRIAVFDGGFPDVDQHEAFRHLIDNDQIVKTWNFPDHAPFVYKNNSHGTEVLSCITGSTDQSDYGLAKDAEFLLARTELAGEPYREQLYWIQAAEWAYNNGANIISSSLGYTSDHYFPEDMNGLSPVAQAARIAFSKGILVINSYGNEGDVAWETGGTPADASEVLSVGAFDIQKGIAFEFSSKGPNQNWAIKPNVCAPGKAVVAKPGGWKTVYGTSFAAPLISGYAACLWQIYPEKSNREIFELIQKSGHLYPYFDYVHGYGMPNILNLIENLKVRALIPINYTLSSDQLIIHLSDQTSSAQKVFYHFVNRQDHVVAYFVLDPKNEKSVVIDLPNDQDISLIRVRYGRAYSEITL